MFHRSHICDELLSQTQHLARPCQAPHHNRLGACQPKGPLQPDCRCATHPGRGAANPQPSISQTGNPRRHTPLPAGASRHTDLLLCNQREGNRITRCRPLCTPRCGRTVNRDGTTPRHRRRPGRRMGNNRSCEIPQSAPQGNDGLHRQKIRRDTTQPQTRKRQHTQASSWPDT